MEANHRSDLNLKAAGRWSGVGIIQVPSTTMHSTKSPLPQLHHVPLLALIQYSASNNLYIIPI